MSSKGRDADAGAGAAPAGTQPYLIQFAQYHTEFRIPELESLSRVEQVPIFYDAGSLHPDVPFVVVHVADDAAAAKLVRRAILVKSIMALWATSETCETLRQTLEAGPDRWAPFRHSRFKYDITPYGHTLTQRERVSLIESFGFSNMLGPIDLKTPEIVYTVAWFLTKPEQEQILMARTLTTGLCTGPPPPLPFLERVWYGRHVANGARHRITHYELKRRRYIGTTSMDAELALLMANQGLVRAGTMTLDPFAGTGSTLVGVAAQGGLVFGSDIDGRQMRGSTGPEGHRVLARQVGPHAPRDAKARAEKSIRSNMEQYHLSPLLGDLLVCDMAHHAWRRSHVRAGIWDAIVTDPPYGVRAGAKQIGRDAVADRPMPAEGIHAFKPDGTPRYPDVRPYPLHAVMADLVSFAAEMLVDGGRLVYWLPALNATFERHPLCQARMAAARQAAATTLPSPQATGAGTASAPAATDALAEKLEALSMKPDGRHRSNMFASLIPDASDTPPSDTAVAAPTAAASAGAPSALAPKKSHKTTKPDAAGETEPEADADELRGVVSVPTHPWLREVSCSCQPFGRWSRWLVTMEKLPAHERGPWPGTPSVTATATAASPSPAAAEADAAAIPAPPPPEFRTVYFKGDDAAASS